MACAGSGLVGYGETLGRGAATGERGIQAAERPPLSHILSGPPFPHSFPTFPHSSLCVHIVPTSFPVYSRVLPSFLIRSQSSPIVPQRPRRKLLVSLPATHWKLLLVRGALTKWSNPIGREL